VKNFDYAAPTSLAEAASLLARAPGITRVLAGGTDLLVQIREHLRDADLVVDVKRIPELLELAFSPQDGLRLGASTPCYRIYGDAAVSAAYPALADATRIVGGWQIQSRASVGGNLCNSSPAGDSLAPLLVLEALCLISGIDGNRELPAAEIALLALLEVLFGVAWAWLGAGEQLSASVVMGGALVLGALVANQALALRRR